MRFTSFIFVALMGLLMLTGATPANTAPAHMSELVFTLPLEETRVQHDHHGHGHRHSKEFEPKSFYAGDVYLSNIRVEVWNDGTWRIDMNLEPDHHGYHLVHSTLTFLDSEQEKIAGWDWEAEVRRFSSRAWTGEYPDYEYDHVRYVRLSAHLD
jgi:hypothetical protein